MVDEEKYDVSGMSDEEAATKIVTELMKCVNCGEKPDGVDTINNEIRNDTLVVQVEFTCDSCGCENSPFAEVA